MFRYCKKEKNKNNCIVINQKKKFKFPRDYFERFFFFLNIYKSGTIVSLNSYKVSSHLSPISITESSIKLN